MKLICTQENLNKALGVVGKIINKNATLPILNNILLKTDKGRLKLSSTNLELGINYWVGSKIEEEGEITVPTRLFANFISSLPNSNVEIKLKEDVLNIKCDKYKTNIKGLSAKEYPLIPKIEAEPVFKINNSDFKQALIQVLPAVSSSESRIEITGVLLDLSKLDQNKIILVATDSYRLAEKALTLKKENINKEALNLAGDISSVIIPKNAVQELIRDLDDNENLLEVIISENQILFKFNNANMISRLLEGKYPDYKQIIPDKFETEAVVNVDEIANAIRVAGLFVSASSNNIRLKVYSNSNILEVSSEASEIGNNNTKVAAEIKGNDLEAMYNHRYLSDGFGGIDKEKAILKINSEKLPTVLTSATDKDLIYVIMPVRA
ncbi:DNA polymerase III subunit beta [Candidatus Parcubacteria bacterium]|nr:DNA polymerase III subunit beta [Candidatus Parcubacteria bacterium]